jgi:hypothetical protein
MSRGARTSRPIASDLFASGWLTPSSAADALGIPVRQLEARARARSIRRRELAPGTGIFLYEVLETDRRR